MISAVLKSHISLSEKQRSAEKRTRFHLNYKLSNVGGQRKYYGALSFVSDAERRNNCFVSSASFLSLRKVQTNKLDNI